MAIIPVRMVLAVVAGAVMPLLLVSGCTSGTSPAASVSAGDGSEQVVADEVRYLQIRGDARVTVLDANVILEVRLASPTPVGDDQAAALPLASARVTNHALDLVRAA
ncbi:hypothetical protein GCM10011608_41040 [Micromonospora sonchi]|uniref:Uncharacterized protein n=1 Tax=Micromonospora sonchi TaxID=1763543 RepID=A0A917U257_9ACTN|nr:hypothetical protein [Micromonospora sonchi]GGM51863.1 hypothetical protein GCM10011608_41040 [Micromonospora sonchi]